VLIRSLNLYFPRYDDCCVITRLNSGDDDSVAEDGDRFLFNQEDRHDTFWRFVREQNWEAVESFFENRVRV
jgi:hypothetical protein